MGKLTHTDRSILLNNSLLTLGKDNEDALTDAVRKNPQWDLIVECFRSHGIHSIAYTHLDRLGLLQSLPALARSNLESSVLAQSLFQEALYREAQKVLTNLVSQGITPMALKALSLSQSIYHDRNIRPSADIDIMVPASGWDSVKETMVSLDFKPIHVLDNEITYIKKGNAQVILEISTTPMEIAEYEQILMSPVEDLWRRAKEVEILGAPVMVMAPEDELMYMITHHVTTHYLLRMIWLCDLIEFIRAKNEFLNWEDVFAKAKKGRQTDALNMTLKLAQSVGGIDPPEKFMERKNSASSRALANIYDPANGMFMDHSYLRRRKNLIRILLIDGISGKALFAINRLLPGYKWLKKRYPDHEDRASYPKLYLNHLYRLVASVFGILKSFVLPAQNDASSAEPVKRDKKLKIALVAISMRRYYSLALPYLKLIAREDKEIRDRVEFNLFDASYKDRPGMLHRPSLKDRLGIIGREIKKISGPRDFLAFIKGNLRNTQWVMSLYNFLMLWILFFKIIFLRPEIIGFSCSIWNINESLKLAKATKILLPKTLIVFGGQEVTMSTEPLLEKWPWVDVIVDGEGEGPFPEILKVALKTKSGEKPDFGGVNGLSYRNNGKVVSTNPRNPVPDLNAIPSPYLKNHFSQKQLKLFGSSALGVMIEATRGCPFRCAFCFEAVKFTKSRKFSLERVADEVRYLKNNGVSKFHILDPILCNASPTRLARLKEIFLENFGSSDNFHMSAEIYAEYITDKNLEYMDIFTTFDVGLQSINQEVLGALARKVDFPKFVRGVNLLKQLEKQINVYLIAGLPGESYLSFLQSMKFVVAVKPTLMFINQLCVLSGSPLRKDVAKYGIEYEPTPPYHMTKSDTLSEDDLERLMVFSESFIKEFNTSVKAVRDAN